MSNGFWKYNTCDFVQSWKYLFVAVLLFIMITVPASATTNDYVSSWGMDEGSGSTISDKNVTSNNIGTINGATWNTTGSNGASLSFDGSNDYVNVPTNATLNITNNITIISKVWHNSIKSNEIVYKGSTAGYLLQTWSDGKIYCSIGDGASRQVSSGTTTVSVGEWDYLACTYDGTDLKLYKNKNLVGTLSISTTISVSPNNLTIGGQNNFFDGLIDDTWIYDRALTFDEINETVDGQQAGATPIITSYAHNSSYGNTTSPVAYINNATMFNVTANQTITTWTWLIDGADQNNNADTINLSFSGYENTNVSVYGTNTNGSTNMVSWLVRVMPVPYISETTVSVSDSDPSISASTGSFAVYGGIDIAGLYISLNNESLIRYLGNKDWVVLNYSLKGLYNGRYIFNSTTINTLYFSENIIGVYDDHWVYEVSNITYSGCWNLSTYSINTTCTIQEVQPLSLKLSNPITTLDGTSYKYIYRLLFSHEKVDVTNISDVSFSNSTNGLLLSDFHDGYIKNLYFENMTHQHFECVNCTNMSISNITVINGGDYMNPSTAGVGVLLKGVDANYSKTGGHDNRISDVYIDGSMWSSIDATGSEYNSIFENISINHSGHNGIDLHGQWNFTVRNATVSNSVAENLLISDSGVFTANGSCAYWYNESTVSEYGAKTCTHDIYIIDYTSINATGAAITAYATANLSVTNLTSDYNGGGIFMKNVLNATFLNVSVKNSTGQNIYLTYFDPPGDDPIEDIGCDDCSIIDSNISGTSFLVRTANTKIINSIIGAVSYNAGNTAEYSDNYYADINVTDINGNAISGAVVSFSPNISIRNQSDNAVNGWGKDRTDYITEENGHTSLPSQNRSNSPVLAWMYQNYTGSESNTQNINWTVSVSKNGYTENNTIIISPNPSWYRSNTNTYQNTTTIILSESTTEPKPNITQWWNDINGFNQTALSLNAGNSVNFNVTVNQTVDNISWSDNGVEQQNTSDITYSQSFPSVGEHNITAQAFNANGSSTIIYTVVTVVSGGGGGGTTYDWLDGIVTDNASSPISGATVTTSQGTQTTNGLGYYSFGYSFVEGNQYWVNVSKAGYQGNNTYINFTQDHMVWNATMNVSESGSVVHHNNKIIMVIY